MRKEKTGMNINSVITKDYINDEIFTFIYTVAMRDAVIQLAYKGEKKPLMKSEILNLLKGEMECLIDKVLNDKYRSQSTYDEDFLCATINISKYINDRRENEEFTFGNAQKFLNIFFKYLYIISYKNSGIKKNFRFCHCPMDQQLLKSIWDSRADIDGDIKLRKRDYFLKSWGNENFDSVSVPVKQAGGRGVPRESKTERTDTGILCASGYQWQNAEGRTTAGLLCHDEGTA